MEQLMLNFDFGDVVERDTVIRRRARTLPRGDRNVMTRHDRIDKRNRTLVARYYYWTELKRRRFDDVVKILSDYEFFVEDRTISNAIVDYNDFYKSLLQGKATGRKLSHMFPGFDWR